MPLALYSRMVRRVVRYLLAGSLLSVVAAVALRTPGIWHAHVGGEAPHEHAHAGSPLNTAHDPQGHASAHAHHHAHGGNHHSHAGGQHHHHHHGKDAHSHRHAPKRMAAVRPGEAGVAEPAPQLTDAPVWHMHFSILGFELTLTWPGAGGANDGPCRASTEASADKSRQTVAQTGPCPADPLGQPSLTIPAERTLAQIVAFELGPLPARVALLTSPGRARLCESVNGRAGCDALQPPTPPPRG
ncbi:MAG: hypothetical protein ACT4QC_12655 [Planctomycetaceae bacterium]